MEIVILVLSMVIVTLAVLIFLEKRKRTPQDLVVSARPELLNNFDCYVINMAKNKNRLANFDKEYKKSDLGSKPYIRWEAVNGFALGDSIKDLVSSKTWLGINFLEATKKRVGDDQLTPGMIGCYQSHYGVWRSVQESGAPCAVIFEDDARIYPTIYQNVIQKIVGGSGIFPADWDIILLGHWCKKCNHVNQFFGIPKYFWGLHGYMISQKGCEVMMKYREPEISVQIDHFMSLLSQKDVLKIFAVHPSYVVTSNFGTDLQLGVTHLD
jgi:GR25 family glycosyltransferase involved in LPS biosynthesis